MYDPTTALAIYTRATILGDNELASVFLDEASRIAISQLDLETMQQLPTRALQELVT